MQMSWRPASTNIEQVDYDSDTDTLTVTFMGGEQYDYMNVPPAVAREFQAAGSAGQFLHRHIKGRFNYEPR